MPSELTDVRVERKRPGPNGLGGHTKVFCTFAGHPWGFRFYGRDWLLIRKGNSKTWRSLTREQREQLSAGAFAALESAELALIKRKREAQQFRSGMRTAVTLALRDKQRQTPVQPRSPASVRPASRTPRSRRNVRTSSRRARAPASSDDSSEPPPDLAQVARASVRLRARPGAVAAHSRTARVATGRGRPGHPGTAQGSGCPPACGGCSPCRGMGARGVSGLSLRSVEPGELHRLNRCAWCGARVDSPRVTILWTRAPGRMCSDPVACARRREISRRLVA